MKKTSKKDEEKACAGEKDAYFCTRNNGEVLKIYWRQGVSKKDKIFFTKSLPERKKRITFAPRESGSSLGICAGCERKEEIKISK
ncbi:hypothetical protein ACFPVY_15675, partial [Flavobacterium qiangtangense]